MNCQKCNSPADPASRFCTQCGAPAAQPEYGSKNALIHNIMLSVIAGLLLVLVVSGFNK